MNDLKRQADALRRARRTISELRAILADVETYFDRDNPGNMRARSEIYQRVHRALHGDKTANNERNDS
jgi:hypothetical protein